MATVGRALLILALVVALYGIVAGTMSVHAAATTMARWMNGRAPGSLDGFRKMVLG